MTNVFSWQNSLALPCFILYSKIRLACYFTNLLTSYFLIPIPYNENDIFFLVGGGWLVLEGLICPHKTGQLQLLHHHGWCIHLDYWDVECFALEMNWDHSIIFETALKFAHIHTFTQYMYIHTYIRIYIYTYIYTQKHIYGKIYEKLFSHLGFHRGPIREPPINNKIHGCWSSLYKMHNISI